MRSKLFIILLLLFSVKSFSQQGQISGTVFNEEKKPLANANVFIIETKNGTVSDENGKYNIRLPYGSYRLKVSFIGYKTQYVALRLSADAKHIEHNFQLEREDFEQGEITVVGNREELTVSAQQLVQMDIKNMPTIYSDVLKTIKLLPGVTSNNELSSSYNVRGGNFDENLIYVNGYEIFRPFLLRSGVEENQSMVNPDLVSDLHFYGGGFPSRFGDRMSSALEINYKKPEDDNLHGTLRVSLLNSGVSVIKRIGNLDIVAGARYAYPGTFLKGIQTKGNFDPVYFDGQLLAEYHFTPQSSLELFLIQSYNKFNLTPDSWTGNFLGLFQGDIRAVKVDYTGEKKYNFNSGLYALKYKYFNNDDFLFNISFSNFVSDENEDVDLTGKVYYNENADVAFSEYVYLKKKFDYKDNYVKLNSKELIINLQKKFDNHLINSGFSYKYSTIKNQIIEKYSENGEQLVLNSPININGFYDYKLTQISGFVQDIIALQKNLQLNFGLRGSYFDYNKEFIVTPRASIHYDMDDFTTLRFAAGLYYQQPFYYEIKSMPADKKLESQKSYHLIAGMERKLSTTLELDAEIYYKKLLNAYSYTIDELTLVYNPNQMLEGYAYGIDIMLKGQIIPGTRNWIGYSYLNTKERPKDGTKDYHRRLLDQTHTVQFFIQDEGKRIKNLKTHARIMFGTGFLFNVREIVTNPVTGNEEVVTNFNETKEFNNFLRVDVGFTWEKKISSKINMKFIVEALNIFDNVNALSHVWVHAVPEYKFPFKVENVLSRRNINVGVQFDM